jgi:hypothetical protein
MEFIKIEQLEVILLIGAIVAIIARRFKVPYTVGLVGFRAGFGDDTAFARFGTNYERAKRES